MHFLLDSVPTYYYYDYVRNENGQNKATEVLAMRLEMDAADSGPAAPMSGLQTNEMGQLGKYDSDGEWYPQGFVYFVRYENSLKIGFSEHVRARIIGMLYSGLRPASIVRGMKPALLGTIPGTWFEECAMHERFSRFRDASTSEWYHFIPELERELQTLGIAYNPADDPNIRAPRAQTRKRRIEQVLSMHRQGMSIAAIAEKCGVSHGRIWQIFRRN